MKNHVEAGKVITITAGGTLAAGAGVLIGDILGVTVKSAVNGEDVACCVTGVFEQPKAAGAIAQGVKVYWDDSAKNITTTSSGNKHIGYAWGAAQSGDATALVRLLL